MWTMQSKPIPDRFLLWLIVGQFKMLMSLGGVSAEYRIAMVELSCIFCFSALLVFFRAIACRNIS
jgi:hypothetical protein